MDERKFNLHNGKSGAAITVQLEARSGSDRISEILEDGTLKIRLHATKDNEAANQALIQFLAKVLKILPAQLEIVAGEQRKNKLITIIDLDKDSVQERILQTIS